MRGRDRSPGGEDAVLHAQPAVRARVQGEGDAGDGQRYPADGGQWGEEDGGVEQGDYEERAVERE